MVRVSRRVGYNHFVLITTLQIPEGSLKRNVAPQSQPCRYKVGYNTSPKKSYLPTKTSDTAYKLTRTCTQIQIILTSKITSTCKQHWLQSVPFQRFQALFNSLFKVLCIFPSRYLFAIGLSPILSFRRNLPPALSCNPKQPDSLTADRTSRTHATDGIVTLSDALFQETYA